MTKHHRVTSFFNFKISWLFKVLEQTISWFFKKVVHHETYLTQSLSSTDKVQINAFDRNYLVVSSGHENSRFGCKISWLFPDISRLVKFTDSSRFSLTFQELVTLHQRARSYFDQKSAHKKLVIFAIRISQNFQQNNRLSIPFCY